MDTDCGFYSCHTVRKMSAEIEELKEQVEQLSDDNHVLKTAFIEQQEEIKSLSEENRGLKDTVITLRKQIKKMKCCGNCKDELKQYDRGGCPDCVDLSKWELAE